MFVTGCYPKEFGDYYVVNSKVMPQNAANVLSWRIIEGLEENIPGKFQILTSPFIGYFPRGFKKLLIRDKAWSHNGQDKDYQLGFINIKGLETYIKSERIYRYVRKWYNQSSENRNILFYSHYAGFMRAAGKIKKSMPDIRLIDLVTDMNEMDERQDLMGLKGKIKGIPRAIMIRTTYANLKYLDGFVLLAERMKEYLKVGTRPYVIIEGISDANAEKSQDCSERNEIAKTFRVVYTGTLHKRYGSVMLAEAVSQIDSAENIELYMCGSGDGEEEVRRIAEGSTNVHYLGVLPHDKAIALQATGHLLVNSMPNFGIHTALSFPSKTMEYMVMGKPVACFKVDGIPNEYDDYLMYFDLATAGSIAKKIVDISKMDRDELRRIGKRNRMFVMEHKTPRVQVKKILDMLDNM